MDGLTELAASLGRHLLVVQAQVCTAESCTGGGIAEAITRIAGSSAWFEAGYITYSNRQKTAQLNVPAALFEQVGAVSREVVEAMASGACRHSGARYGVAVSGIAGPDGGTPDKPVGTVWFAWAERGDTGIAVRVARHRLQGDRDQVRRAAVMIALQGLLGT